MSPIFKTNVYLCFVRAVVAVHVVLLFTSCTLFDRERSVNALFPNFQGRFEERRYYDPAGMFSFIVPKSYLGIVHEDPTYEEGRARVMFADCSLRIAMSIYVETVIEDFDINEAQKNKRVMEAGLKDLYHEGILPYYSEYFGVKPRVVHEEFFSSKTKGLGYLAIVKKPVQFKLDRDSDLDIYLGHLLFFDGQQLVYLALDFPDTGVFNKNIVLIRKALQQMQDSYRNEANVAPTLDTTISNVVANSISRTSGL